MTVFGCIVQQGDPWLKYLWLGRKGLCLEYRADAMHCKVFPKTICDGRTMLLCEKQLREASYK